MQELLGAAAASGSRIELQVYPGAYHGFDRANSPIREYPEYRTATEVVPIQGTDPAAREDVLTRVLAFLARFLAN
jgi:dienelactone hydrolase